MADQAITALPKKTYSGSSKIAATDYLLGIDSAEGYQMLIQDLGEYIINKVTASLAGSNQTLAAAISALNSNSWKLSGGTILPQGANIDEYTTPGSYGISNSSTARTISGLPFPVNDTRIFAFNLKVEASALLTSDTARRQILQFYNDRQKWIRYGSVSGSTPTWNSWEREPSRSEMDAVTSNLRYTATLNDEYFESGYVYIYRYGNVITITGDSLKVKKAIPSGNITVATSDKIVGATGQTPFFVIHDYTNHEVYRGRAELGKIGIVYDGGAAVNDQLFFTVTYIAGSSVG